MKHFVELFLGLGHYHAFFESQKYNYVNQWSQTQFAGGGGPLEAAPGCCWAEQAVAKGSVLKSC